MIPRTPLMIVVLLVLAAIAFSAVWHPRLPETVPTHWNARGEADGFGPRWKLTVLMPGMMVMMTLLLHFLPQLGPFRKNIESFRPTYGRIVVVAMVFLLALNVITVLKAEGRDIPMNRIIPVGIGLLLAVLGNWFGKLRRNFYIGIRTPWTIANDEVWERTHRLGGRLFVVYGLLLVLAGLTTPGWASAVWLVAGLAVIALWVTIYSLVVYRRVGQVDRLE